MKNLFYCLLIGGTLLLLGCTPKTNNGSYGSSTPPEGDKLYFQTVAQRAMSGINTKEDHVVTDDKQWSSLWAKIHSDESMVPNMPQIDFSTGTLLAVFMGEKNTGGFGIEIKEVIDTGKQIVALVEEITPQEGGMVTMAFTSPYHIVKVENPEGKPVVFKR